MLTDMPASGESPNVRRTPAEPAGRRELILDVLRTSRQPHTIVDLAERLGVHANTVRFHLDALLRTGQVEQLMGGTAGPGRPPSLFRATHRMDPAGPTSYRLLATMLTGVASPVETSVAAQRLPDIAEIEFKRAAEAHLARWRSARLAIRDW